MIGKDIFANLQNDKEYQEWYQQIMTNGRNYESPFGVSHTVTGQPSAQDISNSYMLLKQRRPFVIEYYENGLDSKPKSITLYINPERLSMSNNKIIGKQVTRGGIFYHHYGADHSMMSLSGTTGLAGMAGIKQLEEIYYASGTLLRYKNYTPTQIYGSVSNFNVIDYSSPLSVVDNVRTSKYSNDTINEIQNKLYSTSVELSKDDMNLVNDCLNILDIYKNNENLNNLINNTLKDIANDIDVWKSNGNINYRNLNQKIIDTLRNKYPTLNEKIIVNMAHELSIAERYNDEPLIDKNNALYNETSITTIPRTIQLRTMRNNALMQQIKRIKDFENRDKQIRDSLRSGLINLTEDMKDEWLPRQLIIYFENRAYVGHFDSFSYNRDSKTNLINYEMKYTVTKQYEFNNLDEPFSSRPQVDDRPGIVVNPVPPSRPSNNGSSSNGNIYIVQPGDTLEGISMKFYGTIDHWSDIYAANRDKIDDPHWIYPGTQLVIPSFSKTIRHWVVQEGDTLWSLAARFYGDSNQWKRIYDVNPHIKNPRLIYPGDVLKIVL